MALKLVAVQGMTLTISDPTVVATVSIVGLPSIKSKAEGNGIYKDGLQLSVSAITVPSAGATIPDPVTYFPTISATAIKSKADGSLVLRVDDKSSTVNATPQIPSTPSPIPYPVSFTIDITNAGQTKAKSE